jgi:DNA-binding transcriptional LysR family regulator
LVVRPDHEWADREMPADTLINFPMVTREVGSGSRRIIETALAKVGLNAKDLRVTMTLDSTEGLLSAVEAGLGVAFVSRWAVRNQLALGTLKIARVKGLRLSRVFSVAHRMGPTPQGSAGAFHRYLLENADDAAPRSTGKPSAAGAKKKQTKRVR